MNADARRFAAKAFWGALPGIIALALLEARLSRIDTSFDKKRRAMDRPPPSVRLLILGNSLALRGIDPSGWPVHAVNLANVSQSLEADQQVLGRFGRGQPLQTVLCVLTPISFHFRLVDSPEAWRLGLYRRFYGIPGEGSWRRPRTKAARVCSTGATSQALKTAIIRTPIT